MTPESVVRADRRRATRAWMALVLLTLAGMAVARAGGAGLAADGVILAAAVFKGRWMLLDFLKLRAAPPLWRALLLAWLLLVAAASWAAAAAALLRA